MPAPQLLTDLNIRQITTIPNVGGLYGKNTVVTDPVFDTTIVRVTDGSSGAGNYNSMQTNEDPSGYPMWNTDDTLILCKNTNGVAFLFQFNPTTLQATQLGTSFPYKIGGSYCFSRTLPGVIYNLPAPNSTYGNTTFSGTQLVALTYAKNTSGVWVYQSLTQICDFSGQLSLGFNVNWQGDLSLCQGDDCFATGFSEGNQNTGYYVCLYSPTRGFRTMNGQTMQVTGDWGTLGAVNVNNPSPPFTSFTIHGLEMTPNPAYTAISVFGQGSTAVWLNTGLTITFTGLSGHHGLGYQNLYTGNPGGGQYDIAPLNNPTTHTLAVPNQQGPPGLPAKQVPAQNYYGDQHSAFSPVNQNDQTLLWITNGPDGSLPNFPFTSCWQCEVRGMDVTGAVSGAQGTVYRACHTFNSQQSTQYIVTNSLVGVSQTGNFVAFASDWAGSGTVGPLGSTSGAPTGTVGVDARGDVFIVKIPYGTPPPPTSGKALSSGFILW